MTWRQKVRVYCSRFSRKMRQVMMGWIKLWMAKERQLRIEMQRSHG